MKKLLAGALVALSALSLASCGGKDDSKPQEKKIKVELLSWELGTEEKPTIMDYLVDEFNKQSKTIFIKKIKHQGDYTEFLNSLAASGALPDIFATKNVPASILSKQALDITSLVNSDSEWSNVVDDLKEPITYNGKIFSLPISQHYMGFFANYGLLDDYATWENADTISAEQKFAAGNFTTDEFFAAIKATNELSKDGKSKIGVNASGDMINWLPSTLDKEQKIKHFCWDGSSLQYDSQPMYDALTKIQELSQKGSKYIYNAFSKEVPEGSPEGTQSEAVEYFGSADEISVFQNGQMGFKQGASWEVFNDMGDINYKFIGYPDKKVISVSDYLCLSAATQKKEAAFEVAKFLTYGKAGIESRFKVVNEHEGEGVELGGLPIIKDQALVDQWFSLIKTPGFKEVHELVASGDMDVIIEGNKFLPGFQEARFDYQTNIIIPGVFNDNPLTIGEFVWRTCEGEISLGAYKENLTKAKIQDINKIIRDSLDKINNI